METQQYLTMRSNIVFSLDNPRHSMIVIPRRLQLAQKIASINVFRKPNSSDETLAEELLFTRVYFIIMFISIICILIVTSLTEHQSTEYVMNPSVDDYERLFKLYEHRIDCPCSKIAILFSSITQINVSFHPACASEHINGFWWTYYFDAGEYIVYWLTPFDVRQWISSYLVWIGSFCSLANTTISTSIQNFRSTSLITQQIWSRTQFHSELNTTIQQFQLNSRQSFEQSVQFYQDIAQSNSLMSLFAMNWNSILINTIDQDDEVVANTPIVYNRSCSCATSRQCLQAAGIYSYDGTLLYTIDGLMHGCFFIDSFLASSLSCFYSDACLHDLTEHMNEGAPPYDGFSPWRDISSSMLMGSMDATLLKYFSVDDKFKKIVEEAFIDVWSIDVSYESFFRQCAPKYCSYTKTKRFDVLYVVTTFLSLYGGLTFVFKLIIPIIVRLSLKLKRKLFT